TRVSNELGAGRPEGALLAVCVVVVIAILEGAIVVTFTILVRHVWGKLYSNEGEVIGYVPKMMPLLALSDFLDGFQCMLSGAARGCGWQNLCAVFNLGAYYAAAIPYAVVFAFGLHIGGMVVPKMCLQDFVEKNGLGLTCASMAMSSSCDGPAEETNLTGVGEIRLKPNLSTNAES
ncbi:hypothetical protein RJ640_004272, partial [Escallonia rubra]